MLRPDKSTILIQNEFGGNILKARFMNPMVFSVSGTLLYKGNTIPVDNPNMIDTCLGHSGKSDINYKTN
jgi:autotransporter adhesin